MIAPASRSRGFGFERGTRWRDNRRLIATGRLELDLGADGVVQDLARGLCHRPYVERQCKSREDRCFDAGNFRSRAVRRNGRVGNKRIDDIDQIEVVAVGMRKKTPEDIEYD